MIKLCRSLRIAGRSAGSSDSGKSSNTEREGTSKLTGLKERGEPVTRSSREPPTLAEAAARLADSAKYATDTAAYRSRARYLLELDHHVDEDLLQTVLGLLRNHGLSCDVTGETDGDKYILITAPFQVLAAQVFVVLRLSIFSVLWIQSHWRLRYLFMEWYQPLQREREEGPDASLFKERKRKGLRCFIREFPVQLFFWLGTEWLLNLVTFYG